MFTNRSILITRGTGSFGKKFTRTILERYDPKKAIIFSRDELKQFQMSRVFNHDCKHYFTGYVRDRDHLTMVMRGVGFVIHAAVLKQVPPAESNPMECIKKNVHCAGIVIT